MRFLILAVLFAGCFHTKQTQATAEPEEQQTKGKQVAAPRPVGTTPQSILRADGLRKMQNKLKVRESGELDDKTREALVAFQRRHHLAATGLPDLETVETLGLNTNDVFQSGSKKKEGDATARKQAAEKRSRQ
jgi:Putative peptidoglycan binding domain